MIIKVYEKSISLPKVIRLKLVDYYGHVALIAVDEKGNELASGCLLTINGNGTIDRCGSVNRSFGFQLDRAGKIKIN